MDFAEPGETLEEATDRLLLSRMDEYFDMYEVIYARTAELSPEGLKSYEKQPQELGCVKLTELVPVGSMVEVRTLEGDVEITAEEDVFLMIGMEGEVYPIRREKLEKSYSRTGRPYSRSFDYDPSLKSPVTGEKILLMEHAMGVVSSGGSRILAKPLDRYVKLFTAWDEERYYSGNPGDFIARREDDPHDIYIIRGRLFHDLYKLCE